MVVFGVELALEKLADEGWRDRIFRGGSSVGFNAGDVADQDLIETRRQLRGEVAHLVGVREDDEGRFHMLDELGAGGGVAVGGVVVEQGVIDGIDVSRVLCRG
jgi:hypothetical protein